jgi:hypothetical protein
LTLNPATEDQDDGVTPLVGVHPNSFRELIGSSRVQFDHHDSFSSARYLGRRLSTIDPPSTLSPAAHTGAAMGFNKRKMEDRRRKAAEQEAAARRALGPQIVEDSVKLVEAWNARQAAHMPMLFSPTIEAAITAGYWFLWARCPACRTIGDVDLRVLDWHRNAAVTALIPALSCRSCRPNAPFAEWVCLSKDSLAEEYYSERSGNRWISE